MTQAPAPPSSRDLPFGVVAMAASLGGLAVLGRVLGGLPADFPLPVLVAQHLAEGAPRRTAEVLARRARLSVRWAAESEPLRGGTVYLAPPGRHLRLRADGACALCDGPPVQHARPAADPLFASVAETYGERAVGVVLTGKGEDAARGAGAIRRAGGVVIVQDPATCLAAAMPRAVLATGGADFVLPPEHVTRALVSLVMVPGAPALFGLSRVA